MSINEFNNTRWGPKMFATYRGEKYPIAACDFEECLVALSGVSLGTHEPNWVRCENIMLVDC